MNRTTGFRGWPGGDGARKEFRCVIGKFTAVLTAFLVAHAADVRSEEHTSEL